MNKTYQKIKTLFFGLLAIAVLAACNTDKMKETPDELFVGKWKLTGRSMFEGIEVKIICDTVDVYLGEITKLNDNKWVNQFMEVGDAWVSGVTRKSNFEFVLKEKKIANELFSAYGLPGTQEYNVQFEGKNKILLGPKGASGMYVRIKN